MLPARRSTLAVALSHLAPSARSDHDVRLRVGLPDGSVVDGAIISASNTTACSCQGEDLGSCSVRPDPPMPRAALPSGPWPCSLRGGGPVRCAAQLSLHSVRPTRCLMPMSRPAYLCRESPVLSWRSIVVTLAVAVLAGCVSIHYQRPGRHIAPRAGQTLLFGRVRFFHDGREFFPWNVSLIAPPIGTDTERHLWLLRLGRRAVSAELHPDPDGSLSIWLAHGDYALVGSTQLQTSGAPPYEVVALFRVPAGPVAAYAGDLNMTTESHEGGHLSYSELGDKTVTLLPVDIARVTLEQRLGTLPETPVVSPWCVGNHLPGFNDAKLAHRARELLDRHCEDAD